MSGLLRGVIAAAADMWSAPGRPVHAGTAAKDWLSDAVPHLAYRLVTEAALRLTEG